jgi:hypothetical protein
VNEHIDEEIGALLDGRLDERRRSELLARLATADEDYDVFADTASVLQEAEGGEVEDVPEMDLPEEEGAPRSAPVIPLRPRRATGWRSPAVRTLAMAAMVAAVALVPVLRSRMNGGGWGDPRTLAVLAVSAGKPLPPPTDHPWRVMRGGDTSASETGVAARVGALHTDLVIAASSAEVVDTLVSQLAYEVVRTVDGADLAGSASVTGEYQEIAESTQWSPATLRERLAAARGLVMGFVDEDYFAAGAWTEAARVAARRENAVFFHAPESRRAVAHVADLEGLSGKGKTAADDLRSVIESEREIQDWTSLQEDLDTLLDELAR